MNDGFAPDWPNTDLGPMPNRRFALRLLLLALAVPKVLRRARRLAQADVVVARNFDLLVLAAIARALSFGGRPRLVYECLDIHALFTGQGPAARLMRGLERLFLDRIDLLWVSSPGFLRHYFEPVQGYRGPHALVENKLWFDGSPPPRPKARPPVRSDRPITLGWVGSIRCAPSLAILAGAAERAGPALRIAVHGNIHRHAVPQFDAVVASHDTIAYHGPYRYPEDLGRIYPGCDAVWAQDLWQRGGNSDWLLPNRIYEAGWFGCPSIAVAGTETGRRVAAGGQGFVIDAATPEALAELIARLRPADFDAAAARMLAAPERAFRLDGAELDAALAPVLDVAGGRALPSGT